MSEQPFAGWCVLEILGHRRLGGYVREVEIAGAGFLRIDVPGANGESAATQFYPPSSVYCLTPVTEEVARAVARANQPEPVHRWELPAPRDDDEAIVAVAGDDDEDGEDPDEDDIPFDDDREPIAPGDYRYYGPRGE